MLLSPFWQVEARVNSKHRMLSKPFHRSIRAAERLLRTLAMHSNLRSNSACLL